MSIKNRPFLLMSICGFYFANAIHFDLIDLGKAMGEKNSLATTINNKGQVGGIISSCRLWFKYDDAKSGAEKISVNYKSGLMGCGAPPYINNPGFLTAMHCNDEGLTVHVEEDKLYLIKADQYRYYYDKDQFLLDKNIYKQLIDEDKWIEPRNGHFVRINNNKEVVGNVRDTVGKKQVKYINVRTGVKKVLPLKYDCTVTDINDQGVMVGWFQVNGQMNSFLWEPITDNWQIIYGFRAAAINNNRIIVGSVNGINGLTKAAFWENGTIKVIDDLISIETDMSSEIESIDCISDINDKNEMVGWGICCGGYPKNKRAVIIRRAV